MKLIKNKSSELQCDNVVDCLSFQDDDQYVLKSYEEDVTSMELIENLYSHNIIDYRERRRCYKYLGTYYFNAQDKECKDIICDICAITDPIQIITYYMQTRGLSMFNAQVLYLTNRSKDIVEAAKCYEKYLMSPHFIKAIITYLPIDQAEKFLDDVKELSYKYRTTGHFGQKYNDSTPGLMDYIESYGVYENDGLKKYTYNQGMSHANLRDELLDILYNGNIK